jgi:hypothetical protein
MFRIVKAVGTGDVTELAELIAPEDDQGELWTKARLIETVDAFFKDHKGIRSGVAARAPKLQTIDQGDTAWDIQQILPDLEEDDDWIIEARVDLQRSRDAGEPVIVLRRIGR